MVNATMTLPPAFPLPGLTLQGMMQQQLAANCNPLMSMCQAAPLVNNTAANTPFAALGSLTAAHIRATRDVVSALMQCPELLSQPELSFLREFIADARARVGGSTLGAMMGMAAPQPHSMVSTVTVDVNVNCANNQNAQRQPVPPLVENPNRPPPLVLEPGFENCSPTSQMDLDINALLSALDINEGTDFATSSSCSSSGPSTPVLPTQMAVPINTPMTPLIPQPQLQPMVQPLMQSLMQQQPLLQRVGSGSTVLSNSSSINSLGTPTTRTPSSASAQKTQQQQQLQQQQDAAAEAERQKAIIDPRKYKTRMCRNWLREGRCSYEHTCCFAHGEQELRNAAANITVLSSLGYFSSKQTLQGQQPAQSPVVPQTRTMRP